VAQWTFCAKSVTEIAIDGVAPALVSAIHDATRVWIRVLPVGPECGHLLIRRQGFGLGLYYLISRIFGFTFGVKLMERGEEDAQTN
jgi:hypothetical protein